MLKRFAAISGGALLCLLTSIAARADYIGDFAPATTAICGYYTTYNPATGAPFTLAGTPALSVYKTGDGVNSATESTTGVTHAEDFDSRTGYNRVCIDTSADGTFYSAGAQFSIAITTGTVNSVSVVGSEVKSFSLNKVAALRPTTAGRTVVVDAAGLADSNVVKLGPTGSGTAQTARDVGGAVPAAAAGASGGLLISGSNAGTTTLAALTITGATTHTGNVSMAAGLNVTQSSSNTPALVITGNGTGNGATITSGGGATGTALALVAASTNGTALTSAGSGTGNGGTFTSGNGATGTALALVAASTNGTALTAAGAGTGHGASLTSGAGATGDGLRLTAASTNGNGFRGVGTGTGGGLSLGGGGSGYGLDGTLSPTLLATFFATSSGTTYSSAVAGSVVRELGLATGTTVRTNTATAGGATTITLDASASATNSYYVNDLIDIIGGTGVGQTRFITGYVGATKVATVTAWTTNPDNTSVFNIRGFDAIPGAVAPTASQNAQAVWDEALASHTAGGSAGERAGRIPNVAAGASGGLPTVDASNAVKVQSGTGANQISLSSGLVGIASAGISEASYATTTGSFLPLGIIRQGTAAAYTAGDPSVTLDGSAPFATGDGVGWTLILCGSTQAYCDSQTVASYSSATKKATLNAAYNTTFTGTLTYKLIGTAAASAGGGSSPATIADAVWDEARSGHVTSGSFGEYVPANVTNYGGTAGTFSGGRPEVNTTRLSGTSLTGRDIGASVLLSPGTGTGQISITSGALTVGTNNDKTGYALTAAGINGILDATLSGHTTGGTVGGALNSASLSGDPWATAIPGAYGAGTAGNVVGNNLNATISSRAATFAIPTNFANMAITGAGAVTAGTVGDKTGYALTQTFPTNFASTAITAGGAVTAGTVSDKTGYSLSVTPPTAAAVSTQVLADQGVLVGTCSSGSATTCVDAARTEAAASQLQDRLICFPTAAGGDGWCGMITTFTPASDTITTTKTAPSTRSGKPYAIYPATAQ